MITGLSYTIRSESGSFPRGGKRGSDGRSCAAASLPRRAVAGGTLRSLRFSGRGLYTTYAPRADVSSTFGCHDRFIAPDGRPSGAVEFPGIGVWYHTRARRAQLSFPQVQIGETRGDPQA